MTDTWSPDQYNKFQREREQPFFDLADMIRPSAEMRIVDLGCGTGHLTRLLHERLAARETIGLDRSAKMLEQARQESGGRTLRFEAATIESFPGDRGVFDLIFSNAAFHWVEDHPALLARLAAALRPGGQLAFQVPAQHDAPSHLVAETLVAEEPYRSASGGWRRPQPVLGVDEYARLLHRLGFGAPRAQVVVYPHVLGSAGEVIEWMKGTLLTEYARHLPPEVFERFVADYRARLLAQIEPAEPFFFPFKRILCWGMLD
jgi:trans-aconitate 2-methyltransferase